MAYRYCPECDEWYETHEYTVDKVGETVCKVEDHGVVYGYIDGSINSERNLRHALKGYGGPTDDMVERAKEQGLVG